MKDPALPLLPLRLGLCCVFVEQPIQFRNTTVTAIRRMDRDAALEKLSRLCLANAEALRQSLMFCAAHGIGCFRINSQILPLKTHAECGYGMQVEAKAKELAVLKLMGELVPIQAKTMSQEP